MIKKSVTELVGNTPLVQLEKLNKLEKAQASVFAKLEMFNPAGSVKDRIAKSMIEMAEKEGLLKEGSKIVEATSGNTGIGLAAIGVSKGYEVIIVMPDTMSVERRKFVMGYGAKLVLTDGSLGMKGAIAKALEMQANDSTIFIPSQFENKANVYAHYTTTGPEIERALDSKVDVFVAGVGTGGTVTGVGTYLKERNPGVKIVAVEPTDSPVLSGGAPGKHVIQGIGAGFIPSILDTSIYDEIIQVSNSDAIKTAQLFSRTEGLFVGISSGAALYAALSLAKKDEYKDKNIVVLLPDNGDRYLSTALFD